MKIESLKGIAKYHNNCNTSDFLEIMKFDNRNLYKCINCDSYLIYPFPNNGENIDSLYQDSDYLSKITEEEYYGYFSVIYKIIVDLNINTHAKILDFGCGHGYYVKFLIEKGYTGSVGYDINENLVKNNKNHLKINSFYNNYSDLPFNKFDLIISNQVIEHVLNVFDFINNEMYFYLKKNGFLIITTPNINSLNRPILRKYWLGYSPNDHIWFINSKKINLFIDETKFKLVSIKIKSSLNSNYDQWRPKGILKRLIKNTIMRLSELLSRGDQLIFVLQKK